MRVCFMNVNKTSEQRPERVGDGSERANGLSWTSDYGTLTGLVETAVSDRDKGVLRELAKQVAELAAQPAEQEKKQLWTEHHGLKETRPVIFCDPENAWYEIFQAADLECAGKLARIWEMRLRQEIYWNTRIKDDRVTADTFLVPSVFSETERGLETKLVGREVGRAYSWESPLNDYSDVQKLAPRRIVVDFQKTEALVSLAGEVLGDILKVTPVGKWWWSLGMSMDVANLRGMEQMLLDMYDCADGLHELMSFLRDENMAKLDFLEENDLLSLNNGGEFEGTGGYGWTDQLPQTDCNLQKIRTHDMWGFCESQETVGVSADFFDEFIFQYQLPILERFGLNIYGCCEPLDSRWHVIQRIPRLRKVTVSPWSDAELMAENLGPDYVYSRKINPSYMATPEMDEEMARKEIIDTFTATKACGCPAEILLRDVVTLGGNANNAIRWTEIAREESEKIYN